MTDIASGAFHNIALATNGQLFSWGSNTYGECGHKLNCTNDVFYPLQIESEALKDVRIKSISCGENFSGLLTDQKHVLMFGSNQEGQLGIGRTSSKYSSYPTPIDLDQNLYVEQMSLGFRHSLFLASNLKVFGCGLNNCYQLGLGANSGAVN